MFEALATGISAEPPAKRLYYFPDIESMVTNSKVFRRIVFTGESSQLALMTIPVGDQIGEEVHDVDQSLCFVKGRAEAIVGGTKSIVEPGSICIVPAGTVHNFINIGDIPLQLYTFYSPAEHNWNTVHETREQGEREEAEGLDEPPAWALKGLIKKKASE